MVEICSSHCVKEQDLVEVLKEDLKCCAQKISVSKEVILEQLQKNHQSNNNIEKAKEQLDKTHKSQKYKKGILF